MSENFKELYTPEYVKTQLIKFNNRYQNHWKNHIALSKKLVLDYAPQPPARMLDLGCSIGTFAIEFALIGYETIGLDFDQKALDKGRKLACELDCYPEWICEDATSFELDKPVDFVLCFDLFEHMTDEMILKMMKCVKKNLVNGGVIIFHTFPTEFDHMFYKNSLSCIPLIPFKGLSPNLFEKIARKYSAIHSFYYLLRYFKTYKEYIKTTVHPNPLSVKRIKEFVLQAGFNIVLLEAGLDIINPLKPGQGKIAKKYFSKHPIAQRSIWGCFQKSK